MAAEKQQGTPNRELEVQTEVHLEPHTLPAPGDLLAAGVRVTAGSRSASVWMERNNANGTAQRIFRALDEGTVMLPTAVAPAPRAEGAVRLSYSAVKGELSWWYDGDGPVGGYEWTLLHKTVIAAGAGGWNLPPGTLLTVDRYRGAGGFSDFLHVHDFVGGVIRESAGLFGVRPGNARLVISPALRLAGRAGRGVNSAGGNRMFCEGVPRHRALEFTIVGAYSGHAGGFTFCLRLRRFFSHAPVTATTVPGRDALKKEC